MNSSEISFLILSFDEKGLLEIKATCLDESERQRLEGFADKIRAALGVPDAAAH